MTKNKDMWNDSVCHPDIIQELHDIFIEGEDKYNIINAKFFFLMYT